MRPLLLALALLLGLAAPAAADEVFVLDNEYVVRGRVVRETEEKVVVRLSGLRANNTVTLHRSEIRKRYLQRDPKAEAVTRISDIELPEHVTYDRAGGLPRTTRYDADGHVRDGSELPLQAEPTLAREGFGERLARVTRLAFPASFEGRLLVGLLLLIVLSVIVGGGARLLGMKALSLHASTTLGVILGAFLLGDILLHEEMLRADRAIWIVPLQASIWIGAARGLLEAPLSRIVPLFAMVLFASMCFVFLTGSLLVSL